MHKSCDLCINEKWFFALFQVIVFFSRRLFPAIGYLAVYEVIDEVVNALLGVVRQGTGGGLHGVGHHQDGLLAGKGIGARIHESGLVERLVGMCVLLFHIEVFDQTTAVMREDEVLDDCGEIVLLCNLHAFLYMADDDAGAFGRGESIVWVYACLVFGEENRVYHLPNIMI